MKRFSSLAALAAADIAVGFAIQAFMLVSVGVGPSTDAYYAGQAPALVLLAIFQLPLQRGVIAAYGGALRAEYPALRLLLAVIVTLVSLSLVLSLAAEPALRLLYPDLTTEAREIAIRVLHVQGVTVALMAANLVLLSLNQIDGHFVRCEMTLASASILSAIWIAYAIRTQGVLAVADGQLLKAGLVTLGYGALLRGRLSWGVPPWRELWEVVRPLSGAGLLSKLAPLVDRSIASAAASGSLTVLVFVQTIYSASVAVAERAIVAPRLPELKRDASRVVGLDIVTRLALAGLVLVVGLALAAIVAGQIEVVSRRFDTDHLRLFLDITLLLAGFPIGTLSAQWMAAMMVFLGKARLSARIMAACFIGSIPVKYAGFAVGGVRGLAIAMSCYYLASACSLWFVLRHLSRTRERLVAGPAPE